MHSKKQLFDTFIIMLLLLVAIIVRIPLLNSSFWLDEAAQALESSRPLSQQHLIRGDFQPPLLHYLVHFSLYVNDSEWWLRTVGALLPGLITVYYTYKIGAELKNQRTGFLAALLLTTSSFHIFYSQELRQYSLPAAIGAASWFFLLKMSLKMKNINRKEIMLLGILTAAGLYSSYLYPFLVISQLVWGLVKFRRNVLPIFLSFVLSLVFFAPWIPFFLDQLQAGHELQASLPGWSRVVSTTQLKAVPLVVVKFVFGLLDVEMQPLFIGSLGILIFLVILSLRSIKNLRSFILANTPLFMWLVLPVICAWLVSFWVPVLQPKRVLFCLPAFYLIIASLVSSSVTVDKAGLHMHRWSQYASNLLLAAILLINIYSTISYWRNPTLQRENWKSLITEIETRYPEKTVAVFSFTEAFSPWRWYASQSYPTLPTYEIFLSQDTAVSTIKQASEYDFIITFDYLRDLTDPNHTLNRLLIDYGYKEVEVIDYPVIGFVRIYSRPEAVISYR